MRGMSRIGAGVSVLLLAGAWTAWAATEDETAPAAPAPPVVERPAPRRLTEMEKLREELRAKLDGTEWTLELRPMEGTGKNKRDTVSFTGRTVTSDRLAKLGYPTSNYSLNVKEDRTATWETMQTKAGEGVVFWRGELEGETMRGVLSQQPANKPAESYSFVGKQTGGVTPAPAPAEPAQAVPMAEPAPVPSAQPEAAVSAPQPAPAPAAAQPTPAPAPAPEAPKKKKSWLW